MPNPDLIPEPFAQSGDKNPIPLERAISDPIYRASWKAGFPPDTRLPKDLGGEAPDGLDFNGVLNIISQAVVFLQKGNAYQFDPTLAPYPIGALVRSNDNLTTYQSTVPNNSNNPNSNMTGWRVYNGSGFIVDNLTTNDGTKALSAAQGKTLQDNKLGKTDNAVSATKLQTARTIAILGAVTGTATSFDGSANVAITTTSLDATKLSGTASIATTGNAASATKLQTARTINNVLFDGTANITLPTASTSTSGTVQLNNTLTSSSESLALTAAQGKVLQDNKLDKTENASSATKLQNARNINGVLFDGTKNIDIPIATSTNVGTARFATAAEVTNEANVMAAVTPSDVGRIIRENCIGFEQNWVNVTSQRKFNTLYTNPTNRPIQLLVAGNFNTATIDIGGVSIPFDDWSSHGTIQIIIPPKTTYRINARTSDPYVWSELR